MIPNEPLPKPEVGIFDHTGIIVPVKVPDHALVTGTENTVVYEYESISHVT